MTQDRKIIAVAQVSQALQPVEDVKDVLITVLTLRCLFAGVLAYGLGYFLTSHELRPLQTVVNMMHNLNAQQLMQRLKPPRPLTAEVQLLTQTFNQMLERLEASFALQRAFVADVSHELRTPLTAIRGQIDVVLLDPELKPEIRSDIQQVRAELGRLSRLVANLLTNARAETGILPAPGQNGLQRVELDALLVEITRQARFLNEQVTLELGQLEQLRVPGEADLLKQVILNLVDNALAYTPPGGKVCLELQHSSQVDRKRPGEWAVISVNDTGPGIAHDDLPHIFERHYRASAGARSRTGSGLGLYIARLIAEAHQGYIEACSEPGKGSSFKVYLPIII
jgi:signal transduction histidine kinase